MSILPRQLDDLGFGLGLRTPHFDYILDNLPKVDWFEILSENFFFAGGWSMVCLDRIREHYPMAMHGVSLSIGSTDPLNTDYLRQLKQLMERVQPSWVSDHLCWTGVEGQSLHDLLPLPYTQAVVNHVVDRVKQVQDFLGRQILLENVSSYITYQQSEMPEWEFLTAIAEQADCYILLDVNNIYVNAFNHGFDALAYIHALPITKVQQFHLAGHTHQGDVMIDTHDHPIIDPVWRLYREAVKRFGKLSTLIERDDHIPEFPDLFAELQQARTVADQALS